LPINNSDMSGKVEDVLLCLVGDDNLVSIHRLKEGNSCP
jgi:hypothetical protein